MRAFSLVLVSLLFVVHVAAERRAPAQDSGMAARVDAAPPLRDEPGLTTVAQLPRTAAADVASVRRWNAIGELPARAGVVRALDEPVRVHASRRWRGRIDAGDAARVRLQLMHVAAAADATFWVYAPKGPARAFAATLAQDGTLWTPSVEGASIVLEVESESEVSFAIAAVVDLFAVGTDADECLRDAQCSSSASKFATAIGRMSFIRNGQPFLCSGGLMLDRDSTFTPYFLTANQCVSNAAEASSLEIVWDYDTDDCDGPFPSIDSKPRTLGGTVLVTSAASDVTLLRLAEVPPGKRWYMGWDTDPIAAGTRLARVSHPHGLPHMVSISTVTTTSAACSRWPRPNFLYSTHVSGGTATGSTGAPLFYNVDGYVVGQLSGACGADAENPCGTAERVDGALSASWPLLKPYLDPTPSAACAPNATTACLLGNRFRVSIAYRNQFANPPQTGELAAQRLNPAATNPDTAIFGFGNAQNVEVVVRIVDARPFAPRFDIYYGGLTDVEYTVSVTDVARGLTREYRNPPGAVGGGVDRSTFPAE